MEINHEKFSFEAQRNEFYLVQGFRSSIGDRRQARFERHLVWNDVSPPSGVQSVPNDKGTSI